MHCHIENDEIMVPCWYHHMDIYRFSQACDNYEERFEIW